MLRPDLQDVREGVLMGTDSRAQITVRDATEVDVPMLTRIKGAGTEALHHDRLRDARSTGFRYLVLVVDQAVIGFACLVLNRPDADTTQHLPRIEDVRVQASQRGRGYGAAFLRALEGMAADAGYRHLYLAVAPVDNPRAFALYQRIGYQPLQSEPYYMTWEFTDSGGITHSGEEWVVDMVKPLPG